MKLKEVARLIGGELVGDGDIAIKGINGIDDAKEGDLSFVLNEKSAAALEKTKASCVIVPKAIEKAPRPIIRTDNPLTALATLVETLLPDRISRPKGVHRTAMVGKGATLAPGASVGAYCVIDEGVSIGENTLVYPLTYIGKNSTIGRDCAIYPNVTIREEISIGDRVVIHSGTVIGSDGFGYQFTNGAHQKIPQIGTVLIEDDVEIGANVTIDRATVSKTVIGKGTKIDNLVQIAHNVKIGRHCVIVAMCGISGSTKLGDYVTLGGQVGLVDHIKVGDGVKVGAQSGITKDVPAGSVMFGTPALPMDKARQVYALFHLLPRLHDKLNALERKVKELENK